MPRHTTPAIIRTRDGRRKFKPNKSVSNRVEAVDDFMSSETIDPDFDRYTIEELLPEGKLPHDEDY